jgi:hypothetical protein
VRRRGALPARAAAQPRRRGLCAPVAAARAKAAQAFRAISRHFDGLDLDQIVTTSRLFPARMRADLQLALDVLLPLDAGEFHGLLTRQHYETLQFAALLDASHYVVQLSPPRFEEIDVGEDEPVRCLENGLWLRRQGELPYAVCLATAQQYGQKIGVQVEVAVPTGTEGGDIARALFARLESAVAEARSYRGKVLSLESSPHSYTGQAVGVCVHRLEPVSEDQILLPAGTLRLLRRNVVDFAASRPKLAELGMPLKKGLLFHGPPGTGKTYTIRYLAGALPDHTTLLVTAEQVGLLPEYVALARLLQPSLLVFEDADLIARDRTEMGGPCEESLLNRLLNEMDGLREDARIFFILTTNRPEALEPAIANRPGRIDQAIEFPLPDEAGRRALARIYSRGLSVSGQILDLVASLTDRASPAFIKELMRRAAQEAIGQGSGAALTPDCVERALQEMMFDGGRLNVRLLGGTTDGE